MSVEQNVVMNELLYLRCKDNFKFIGVKFASSQKEYIYRSVMDTPIKVGDSAIVDSPYTGLTLVKVTSVIDPRKILRDDSLWQAYPKWILTTIPAEFIAEQALVIQTLMQDLHDVHEEISNNEFEKELRKKHKKFIKHIEG